MDSNDFGDLVLMLLDDDLFWAGDNDAVQVLPAKSYTP